MSGMSSPYDENPQSQPPGQNPYGQQPTPNPYGQPSPNPYEQPAPYGGGATPAPYGQPYGAPQEHPQGTMVLVLGIIGIFVAICAPIAWYLGNKTKKEIAASGAHYANESQINTGRILGKVFTIIWIIGIVLYIVFFIVLIAVGASQSGG